VVAHRYWCHSIYFIHFRGKSWKGIGISVAMVHSSLTTVFLLAPIYAFAPPPVVPRLLGVSRNCKHGLLSIKLPEEGQELSVADSQLFDPFLVEGSDGADTFSLSVSENVVAIGKEERQQLGIWAARGLLLLVAMLWGTNFASVKYLETLCFHPPCNHPPSEAALARFGVAAFVSLPLLIGQRKDVILGGFECGLWITLGYITQAMALQTISSGKCAFICSLTVVVVPLLSSLFGKPIKPINIVSAIVALTGVGVLEGLVDVTSLTDALAGAQPALAASATNVAESASFIESSSMADAAIANPGVLGSMANAIGISKGDLLALGQPLGFGLSFMRIEHYVEKFEDVENRILTIAAAECVIVGVVSLLWVLYDFHGIIPDFGYMVCYCFTTLLFCIPLS
jgi:drug/metabolite transporter (DMT)-like permease